MSKQFFITGLPRSRTAWFATLFTWGDSLCYHDALCPEIGSVCGTDSLRRLQSKLLTGVRGHSDASNILVWRTLQKWFPEARWVVIDRVFEEAVHSSRLICESISEEKMRPMFNELSRLAENLKPMVVKFEEIDPIKCYEIAEYLSIDIGPATRVRQLCDMNIQIHPSILKRRLESLKGKLLVDSEKAA